VDIKVLQQFASAQRADIERRQEVNLGKVMLLPGRVNENYYTIRFMSNITAFVQ